MSTLIVENLKGPTTGSNANTITIPSGQTLLSGIIQSAYTELNTKQSIGTNVTWTDVLTLSITPKSTNSKFILCPSISVGIGYFTMGIRLLRDGTAFAIGDSTDASGRTRSTMCWNGHFSGSSTGTNVHQQVSLAGSFESLASASDTTTAIVFKAQAHAYSQGVINASQNDANDASRHRTISSMVVYEVMK
tara:strand:+ start:450 stop:1022 length:573 start_codon:yes stop_codon:yes gene_type:complete